MSIIQPIIGATLLGAGVLGTATYCMLADSNKKLTEEDMSLIKDAYDSVNKDYDLKGAKNLKELHDTYFAMHHKVYMEIHKQRSENAGYWYQTLYNVLSILLAAKEVEFKRRFAELTAE